MEQESPRPSQDDATSTSNQTQTQLPPPQLEPVFYLDVTVGDLLVIGPSKHGQRQLIPITGGVVQGNRLQGTVLEGGADWQLQRADGLFDIDARYTVQAQDGDLIHVRNRGVMRIDSEGLYIRATPQFEAPLAGEHSWLNRALFVSSITLQQPGQVRVSVYRVQ